MNSPASFVKPSLHQIAPELFRLSSSRRVFTLFLPFFYVALYFVSAGLRWWPLAVFALVALSFVTYGSISHDLVHRNLGLPKSVNDVFLSIIELLALRSGHAYRMAHLHHHARFPHRDDIEGAAAKMSFPRTMLEGVIFQFKIWFWAVRRSGPDKRLILLEGFGCLLLGTLSFVVFPVTPVLLVYVVLMTMGSWIIPLITSYIPHNPSGETELLQTRLFRGKMLSIVALEHTYHLEHHLYPAVPHHNWPQLAKKLDPYFESAGLKPIRLWF
ncbi:MAG TPA: fatty acid desaturase [Pyrinomonadaceae bacterium]|nr:fatty acid desaturase [Pyrinomonadaceae bacterium]